MGVSAQTSESSVRPWQRLKALNFLVFHGRNRQNSGRKLHIPIFDVWHGRLFGVSALQLPHKAHVCPLDSLPDRRLVGFDEGPYELGGDQRTMPVHPYRCKLLPRAGLGYRSNMLAKLRQAIDLQGRITSLGGGQSCLPRSGDLPKGTNPQGLVPRHKGEASIRSLSERWKRESLLLERVMMTLKKLDSILGL